MTLTVAAESKVATVPVTAARDVSRNNQIGIGDLSNNTSSDRRSQGMMFDTVDKLFDARDDINSLKQAVSMANDLRVKDPQNFEAVYRVAKYTYYLADRDTDNNEKQKLCDAAIEAAKKAVQLNPNRVEGHFWLAASQGQSAKIVSWIKGLELVGTVRDEFEAAKKIDPKYGSGSIDLALGQMDLKVPGLFGGNAARGLGALQAANKIFPHNAELKLALGDAYEKNGRADEARPLYTSILNSEDPNITTNELNAFRAQARANLKKLS